MRYYIADCHFYHKNLLTEMDNRGFESVAQMNEVMIEKWNKKVHAHDEVVILGDLSLGYGKETNEILCRLKGRLCLIRGNHDERYLRDRDFDASRFEWVKDYAEIHDNKRKIVLMHYPIFCYNGQFRRGADGTPLTYMLHGHIHKTPDQELVDRFCAETRATPAQDCASGRSETGALPDDQLLLHVFGLHAADTGRMGGVREKTVQQS